MDTMIEQNVVIRLEVVQGGGQAPGRRRPRSGTDTRRKTGLLDLLQLKGLETLQFSDIQQAASQ